LGPTFLGLPRWAEIAAFAGAYVAGGVFSLVRSVKSLRGRRLDIDLLMLLSALGAGVIGEYAEGAALLFLFSLSNALESRALRRTTSAIGSLMKLRPDEALRLDAEGNEHMVAADDLEPGEVVRVRPGGRIPVDGHLQSGFTAVDQAAITGESEPAEKGPGDLVFSGTINVGGTVEIEVDKLASESTLSRIIELVEEAREAKAPTQRFIDRFEQGYAATVIFAAVAATLLPLAFGEAFRPAFYRAMTLLVVASPCAVVISTPATILAALAHAARRGLLFKGGAPLETLATVETVAFDKTGTLTAGKASVLEVVGFGQTEPQRVLELGAAVGRLSEHHLGRAIFDECTRRKIESPRAVELRSQRGLGAVAEVNGQSVAIGRLGFVEQLGGFELSVAERDRVEQLQLQGRSMVFVVSERDKGVIALEDQVRPEAAGALRSLKANGVGRTLLLTGDNEEVARRVAEQVGVDEYQAQLMPEDKVALIRGVNASGEPVAMVGDGVNDAPALAASSVGVAMGLAGTDAALEVADLVLVRDRLDDLAYAVRLAKRSLRIIRQNLAFACAVIAVLVVINLLYGLALPIGVVGHEGSTILVVLNGLRLLRPLPADRELEDE
jgi:Cd2+/Zn2+-exporting ATPase